MRSALAATTLAVLVACPAKPTPIEVAPPRLAAGLDTTGYGGLDWGATVDQISAAYPDARTAGDNLTVVGHHEGRRGITTFELADAKLFGISVSFDDIFLSMDECGTVWAALRASIDQRLGPSTSDNLAAYWTSAKYAVTLACDPGDGTEASLGMSYAPALAD
jgi:hypothetical protein